MQYTQTGTARSTQRLSRPSLLENCCRGKHRNKFKVTLALKEILLNSIERSKMTFKLDQVLLSEVIPHNDTFKMANNLSTSTVLLEKNTNPTRTALGKEFNRYQILVFALLRFNHALNLWWELVCISPNGLANVNLTKEVRGKMTRRTEIKPMQMHRHCRVSIPFFY